MKELSGVTGNEVKFLVSLGIDEKKSRAEIQSFINKTTEKENKLTFGVNKTQSNTNINAFLADKRKAIQHLIFGVNKGASLAKINGDLREIKGSINPINVTLDIDYITSLTKINNFMKTAKVNPKLIDLALSGGAIKELKTKIDNTQLNKAKLSFKLTSESFKEVDLQLKNKIFKGVKIVAELDMAKTIAKLSEQISKMKLPNVTISGSSSNTNSGNKAPVSATPTPTPSSETISPFGTSSSKVYSESAKELAKLRAEYAQTGKEVVLFNNDRSAGEKEFIKNLKSTGRQVKVTTNEHTGEITQIVATYKSSSNEINKEFFTPIKHQFSTLDASTKEAKYEINGFVKAMSTLNNTETFNLKNGIKDFKRELELARQSATILTSEYTRLMNASNNVTSRNQLDEMNRELKEQQAILTRNISLEEKQASLKLQYQQLITNLTRTEKMYLRTVNTAEAELIRNRIAQISQLQALTNSGQNLYRLDDGAFRTAQNQIRGVRGEIRQLNADATEATKNSMGILDAMKVAFERFPIWMIASTAFYGTIRSVRELGTIIIDLDTKMTELKKVMADGTDFGALFRSATADAENFGQTISSTLDAYAMFAKQGYAGDELSSLSQAALLAGNVGDIETGRAAEYLTASLAQWNLESKDALSIVDTWNELSNDYATTVENLAQGLSKSGSTAKAMGLDFSQTSAIVGTLTAKMKQSGNEIGNFIKATLPNLISNKGRTILGDLGVQLEDENGNLRDVIEIYREVAVQYKDLSQADRNNVTLGLGGKYHIARLQTFLDDLGSIDSMYDQMYESAENSANSAINENAVYMESLQAKINLARVEVEKLATAMGEVLFTDAMVAGLQIFGSSLSAISAFVTQFGALPITLGLGVTALTLFSTRFGGVLQGMERGQGVIGRLVTRLKDYTSNVRDGVTSNLGMSNSLSNITRVSATTATSVNAVATATARNTSTTERNTASTNASATATSRLSGASRMLTASFGVLGIASLAIGYGIEKLLSAYGDAKKAKEALITKTEQENKVYSDNREQIHALMSEYNKLNSMQGTGKTAEDQKRSLEIQNELAKLMPSINTMEDEFGNSVFTSTEQVKTKIALLEAQLKVQEKINKAKEEEALAEAESSARSTVDSSESKIDTTLTKAYSQLNAYSEFFEDMNIEITEGVEKAGSAFSGFQIQDIESFEKAISNIQNSLSTEDLSTDQRQEIESLLANMNVLYIDLLESQGLVMSSVDTLRGTYVDSIEEIIGATEGMSSEGSEAFTELTNSVLGLVNSEDDLKSVEDAIRVLFSGANQAESTKLFESLTQKINEMKTSGITDMDELEKEFGSSMAKIKMYILEAFVGAGFKRGSDEYVALEASLTGLISTGYEFTKVSGEMADASGRAVEDTKNLLMAQEGAADAFEMSGDEAESYLDTLKKYSSVSESLIGVTEKHISESKDLVSVYKALSNSSELTTDQQKALGEATTKLSAIYPHLVRNKKLNIEAVESEIKANELLEEAHKALADGKLTQEEEMTLYAQAGAKSRIEILQQELEALVVFQNEQVKIAREINQSIANIGGTGKVDVSKAQQSSSFVLPVEAQIKFKEDQIDREAIKINSNITSSIGNIVKNVKARDEAEKSSAKSSKESAKETSELTKITDKYTLAQERLNTALAKVREEQKNLSEYSKEYRNSISAENELIEQQIALNNKKIADLSKVKKGGSTTTTSTGGSTVVPAGASGAITAPYNQKRSGGNHKGIDLDGAIGDRLDAFVAGEVVKQGKTDRSGNFVQILDSQGVKHFYAHLDSIATKLGDMVDVGTKIGTIGNTGNVVKGKGGDGSHLHYEVKDANKQYIDPTQYVKNARKGVTTTGTSSTSTTKDERGDALQQIEKLKQENLTLSASIQDNYYKQLNSNLSEFQRDRDKQSESIQRQEALQARMLSHSQEYEDSVNRQYNSTKDIIKSYKEEDAFLAKKLKAGGLESKQVNELRDRRLELNGLIYDSQNTETEYFEKVVASRMARFTKAMDESNNLISEEENALESLNSSSGDYEKSQMKIVKARESQYTTLKQELAYTEKMIATGKLSAQTYEEMTQKAFDLKNQILDTAQAIQKLNYEMIQTVKNSFDIKIDDVDFDLSYIQELRSGYDDTSGDYLKSYNLELDLLKDKMKLVKEQGEEMKKSMRDKNLGINELQDLEEQLEDNALAYASIGSAIKSAEKAIVDFNTRIEENIDKLQEEMADNIIEQLKKAVNKAKDIAIDAVDDLIEKEEERHEKVMKQYDNELKAYQKLIDSKRREINDSDRDRTFDNTIGELEEEKQGYQSRLNAISGINTFDAKKEREELQKQIAEVDEKIAEENYQYEKTLREQQLDDLLEQKEEEIEVKKETETESHNLLVKSLNKQKEAWQKYYDDLLDNEKLFADMREMILQGNFDGVEQMFMQHVSNLTFQLPELEAKFQSTWDAVAQGIRTTVLTSFDAMQSKIRETTSAIDKLKASMKSIEGNWDIPDVNMTAENGKVGQFGSDASGLSNADLQVILAKFMNEQIAGKLNPETDKSRIANIKEKSYALAEKGRTGGSTISADSSLDSVLSGLSQDQIKKVGSYFSSNASSSGFSTKDYVSYIEEFGNTASQGALMTSGDLQVMTAKYIREKLLPTASDSKTKDSLRALTDTMANSGRGNLSLISSSTGFDAQFNKLTSQQKRELGDYMISNSGTIPNVSLKKMMESYGKKIASMDSGGMTGSWGSTGGVDGKGGRFGVLHQDEIINNPLDTERMLKVSSVLDNVFARLNGMSKSPDTPTLRGTETSVNQRPSIEVYIENMTGSKGDVDNMIKQIDRKLFREKGRGNG